MNTIQTIEPVQEELTVHEINFSRLVAKGFTLTYAYRHSFPTSKKLANYTVRKYASELATKQNIITEVATTRERQARLARLSEDRIEEILIDGDIDRKENKVADISMFMYEQANGKATQRVEHQGVFVTVQYDLSGGKGGEVPQEIIDQLQD